MQCLLGPLIDILNGPSGLQRRDHRDRVDPPPFRQGATVGYARLVEMDMRLDEPGADEPPGGVIAFAIRRKRAADRGDPAILDSDIEEAVIEPIDETGISDDQIHATALVSREALASLDDLVGAGEQVWRNFERERFRRLQI